MAEHPAILDAEGWLTLPMPVAVKTGILVACPPSWLVAGKFEILDQHAVMALNRRIARLRTSGAMPVVQTMEAIYRQHALLCRFDPAGNRLQLPPRLALALGPLPCTLVLDGTDGHLSARKPGASDA